MTITKDLIQNSCSFDFSCCNGHDSNLLIETIRKSTNIFINNYCKLKNDDNLSAGHNSK